MKQAHPWLMSSALTPTPFSLCYAPLPLPPCSATMLQCRSALSNAFSPMLETSARHDMAGPLGTLSYLLNPLMAFPQYHRFDALPAHPSYPELAMPFTAAVPPGFESATDVSQLGPERGKGLEHLFIINLVNVFNAYGGLGALFAALGNPDRLGLEGLQLMTAPLQQIAPRLRRNMVRVFSFGL